MRQAGAESRLHPFSDHADLTDPADLAEFADLAKVEATLRDALVASRHDGHFLVRFLGTQGEAGARCLTLNLEMRPEAFDGLKDAIERVIVVVRHAGFVVDELLQRVADVSGFDVRFWVLIYETDSHDDADAAG